MYYHASSIGGITRLEPHISNHGLPLIYFSTKRENVLVYLSNSWRSIIRMRWQAHIREFLDIFILPRRSCLPTSHFRYRTPSPAVSR